MTGAQAVLVTGGGTGIGAAVARALTADGARVAICGRRPGPLKTVAAQTGAIDIACDIADTDAAERLVATAAERLGGLDGLVLNAGIISSGGVADLSVADFTEMIAVNLTGAFAVAKAALPHLLERRGAVVGISSVAALRASSAMAGYSASKAGLTALTQSLAVDHAHEGLRANVICPGWTITEMADMEMTEFGAERGLGREDAYQLVTALVPARRAATADEVAAAVCWLLSGASAYLNGAVIPVDGAGCAVDAATIAFDPRVRLDPAP